jgi:hypothetical protein
MVVLVVIFWIFGCIIASSYLRFTDVFFNWLSNTRKECYFLSGIFSLLGQIAICIGGCFFFGMDFLKYCKGNNITLRVHETFSMIGGLLLLGTFVLDISILSTLNERTISKEEV